MVQKELDVRSSLTPSVELQRWLQITYELELKSYNEKKALAEQQLLNAKVSQSQSLKIPADQSQALKNYPPANHRH